MAELLDISDAVVAELNKGSLSMPVTAVRAYLPQFDLPDMAILHVTVVPRAVTIVIATRSEYRYEYRIDVAVQQKLQSGNLSDVDALIDLAEEITDLFRGVTLADVSAVCVAIAHEPVYVVEHMQEMRQLTSVISLTFRTQR